MRPALCIDFQNRNREKFAALLRHGTNELLGYHVEGFYRQRDQRPGNNYGTEMIVARFANEFLSLGRGT